MDYILGTGFDCAGMGSGAVKAFEEIVRRRSAILEIAARHGAGNVRVFGSAVRGEADAASDIDMLVDMDADRSLLDLIALERELEDILGRHVDVVVEGGISPHLTDRIHAEAIVL